MMTPRKFLGIVLGLVLLVGSGVVVGLTVVRLQNQKATITQPKASGVSWPSCAKDQSKAYWCTDSDCFNSSDDSRNITKCCNSVGSNPFACAWPARGWCKPPPEQCPSSGGQRCALYFFNQGSGCYGYSGGGDGGGSSASFTATYPVGGAAVDSLKPTFTWTANTTGLSYNCLNVHTDQCITPISALSGCPSTSDRSWTEAGTLSPNTTYYWVIYGQPGTPAPGSGCQSFKTGAGTTTTTCTTGQTVCGTACCNSGQTCTNGACVTPSCTTDASCPTGKVCAQGACVDPANTHFGCSSNTCIRINSAGSNTDSCSAAGGTCVSDGGQINSCWGNEGADGKCYDCNGDGAVNILDFSCFAKDWLANVTP